MRKIGLSLIILLFGMSSLTWSHGGLGASTSFYFGGSEISGILTSYGGIGRTSTDVDVGDGSQFHYGFGSQILLAGGGQYIHVGAGLDIGYSHLYNISTPGLNRDSTYVNVIPMIEGTLFIFTLQLGLGPYFGVGETSGTEFGIMLAGGFNLPIDKYISIPILVRSDIILADQTAVPISFITGITFFLPD